MPDIKQITKNPVTWFGSKKKAQIKEKNAKIMLKNQEYMLEYLLERNFQRGIDRAPLKK